MFEWQHQASLLHFLIPSSWLTKVNAMSNHPMHHCLQSHFRQLPNQDPQAIRKMWHASVDPFLDVIQPESEPEIASKFLESFSAVSFCFRVWKTFQQTTKTKQNKKKGCWGDGK